MAMNSNPAQRERAALCELFVEVGPDAPTLCGDWTTRDLAAHLVVRERRPDAAVGIIVSKAAGYTDKVQAGVADGEWDDLIDTVRSGPPIWSPTKIAAIDKAVNTVEFFVHHEDVRRAGDDWEPRELDADLTETLYSMLSKMAKRLVKSSTGRHRPRSRRRPSDDRRQAGRTVGHGERSVGELVMFVYGRQAHSRVEITGDDVPIATVTTLRSESDPRPPMADRQLTGAIVAVVGATGGLGREVVAALETRGATVVRAGRNGAIDVEVDLRDSTAGDTLVGYCVRTHGRLDGVIVAAGIVAFGDLVDTDDVVMEELFLTNTLGPMWLAKRVAPALVESQGFFVNISGIVAESPMPGMAAYSASKAACRGSDGVDTTASSAASRCR